MKQLILVLVVLVAMTTLHAENNDLQTLEQWQWKNRLLIIWSDEPNRDLLAIESQFGDEINDRDLLIFVISDSDIATNHSKTLSTELYSDIKTRFSKDKGRYFLIGKDGGVKSSGHVFNLLSVFGEIDRMPMRRQEIKNQSKK